MNVQKEENWQLFVMRECTKKEFVGEKNNNRLIVCYERKITYYIYWKDKMCEKNRNLSVD